jgi:ribosomal 50S subunit-associated protein YjgA (DUF615 family)
LVNQSQSNTMFLQRLHELRRKPILIPDFDGKLLALWQFLQEWPEPNEEVIRADESLLVEVAELEQTRSELVTQQIHRFHELLELGIAIY